MKVEPMAQDEVDNVLERAKAEGLKVTDDGRIVLPGTKTPKKAKAEKAPKEPKAPKAPKALISSKIVSSGDTIANIIDGLTVLNNVINRNEVTCPYKVSTYKDELRVAFQCKANDIFTKIEDNERETLERIGMKVPEGKEFFAMKIA